MGLSNCGKTKAENQQPETRFYESTFSKYKGNDTLEGYNRLIPRLGKAVIRVLFVSPDPLTIKETRAGIIREIIETVMKDKNIVPKKPEPIPATHQDLTARPELLNERAKTKDGRTVIPIEFTEGLNESEYKVFFVLLWSKHSVTTKAIQRQLVRPLIGKGNDSSIENMRELKDSEVLEAAKKEKIKIPSFKSVNNALESLVAQGLVIKRELPEGKRATALYFVNPPLAAIEENPEVLLKGLSESIWRIQNEPVFQALNESEKNELIAARLAKSRLCQIPAFATVEASLNNLGLLGLVVWLPSESPKNNRIDKTERKIKGVFGLNPLFYTQLKEAGFTGGNLCNA